MPGDLRAAAQDDDLIHEPLHDDVLEAIGRRHRVIIAAMAHQRRRRDAHEALGEHDTVGAGDGDGVVGLEAAVDTDDASRALVLWLNDPSNPTGACASHDEIVANVEWARDRGIVVASDVCPSCLLMIPMSTPSPRSSAACVCRRPWAWTRLAMPASHARWGMSRRM